MQETAYSCPFAEDPANTDLKTPVYSPEMEAFVAEVGLTQIQNWKFELIARKLGLHRAPENGEAQLLSVLDIGCGVGGLAIYIAEHFPERVGKVVGITLSERQKEVAEREITAKGLQDKVEIRIQNYQDLEERGAFDRVASVGMMEHVGAENWAPYMQIIQDVSTDVARCLVHSITTNKGEVGSGFETAMRADDFIQYLIFPGGELPTPTEMAQAAVASGFTVEHQHHFGIYYYFGLKKWYQSFCREEAAIFQALRSHKFSKKRAEFTIRKFKIYLASCAQAFKTERCDLVQLVLNKSGEIRDDKVMIDYMRDVA